MMDIDAMIDMVTTRAVLDCGMPVRVLGMRAGIGLAAARIGKLDALQTAARWMPQEDHFLRENIGKLTDAEIGAALGRSDNAVKIRRQKQGYPAASKRPGWLTGHGAGKVLGSDIHNIMMLTSRGILPHEILPGVKGIIAVKKSILYRWAVNPENWVYFKAHKVQDEHLRRLLARQAERWGDAWWSTGQVAEWHGVDHQDVKRAILRGKVAGVKWGNWWVKRSEAMRPGLLFPKGKGAGHEMEWSEAGDAFLVLAHAAGIGKTNLAGMMGWKDSGRVDFRLKRLWEGGQVLMLAAKYGLPVRLDMERGLMLADWRDCPGRFPALERALAKFRRFLNGERKIFKGRNLPGMVDPDLNRVRGLLAVWAAWHAKSEAEMEMARKLRYACHARAGTLAHMYGRLLEMGVDPVTVNSGQWSVGSPKGQGR